MQEKYNIFKAYFENKDLMVLRAKHAEFGLAVM
jgi:hypothetical protein